MLANWGWCQEPKGWWLEPLPLLGFPSPFIQGDATEGHLGMKCDLGRAWGEGRSVALKIKTSLTPLMAGSSKAPAGSAGPLSGLRDCIW